jgi:threonylcarbamoyladenosine tRNA methylthiotransferase MtaB
MRTRAFLKIQQGCNARCTYCIVPAARGPESSVPSETVRQKLKALVERGFREIVLVGIHLGRYGHDIDPPISLAQLLRSMSSDAPPARIRLSSIEPMELTDELVSIMADSPVITPHLHIPLQSGDDTILAAMGRPYNARLFERVVTAAARRLGSPAVGVDVMVGFPGEGEKEFAQTMDLIERLPITYLHVFPFSRRPGTPAFSMDGEAPGDIKKKRALVARELGRRKKEEYINSCLGKEVAVLVEEHSDGTVCGKSENYLEVYLPGTPDDINRFVRVVVERAFRDGVYGTLRR